ncbi:putative quinol monooxygenase [Parabacteroides sp. AM08-6]|uniref:putative quinol monooxygenase n=1 Tax=Parabacteroides sp. AM08-6 TaxID=2292053 RepID=UPI001F35B760|nr:putative quinol monooxygenase [Parabacteroides sp. AM08-6]
MKKIVMILMAMVMIGATSCNGNAQKGNADKACDQACAEKTTPETPKKEKKTIVCRVLVKEGQEAAFIEVAKPLIDATRQETGNISYNLYQSPSDPKSFIFYEEYKDDAAFDFHANSEHFKTFAAAIPDMLAAELNIEQF